MGETKIEHEEPDFEMASSFIYAAARELDNAVESLGDWRGVLKIYQIRVKLERIAEKMSDR